MKLIGTLALVLGLTAACSSDTPAQKGMVNEATAKASIMQAGQMRSAADMKSGPMLAATAFQMNATSQGLVSPAAPGQKVMAAGAGPEMGTQMCTDTGCTFMGWSADGMTQFDGTVMFSPAGEGKHIVWDLTMKTPSLGGGDAGVPQLMNFNYKGKGDITVSATSLDGSVNSDGSVDTTMPIKTSVTWNTEVKYQAITIAGGNPTAGSIYAKVTTGAAGVTQSYEGTKTYP